MKSIFIAENNNHVRAALRLLLEYQPEMQVAGEADHAESLLAQVCRHPPDVILLDWNLPGIHPQRLIKALREHCPTTLLVAISIKPDEEEAAEETGMDGFLLKQVQPDQFVAALTAAIQQKS